jgi:hypothetical protein
LGGGGSLSGLGEILRAEAPSAAAGRLAFPHFGIPLSPDTLYAKDFLLSDPHASRPDIRIRTNVSMIGYVFAKRQPAATSSQAGDTEIQGAGGPAKNGTGRTTT